MKQTSKATVV